MTLIQAKEAAIIARPTKTTALVPIRVRARRVPSTEPTAMERATGRIRTPVSSGLKPCSSCMNCVIRKMKPNSAKNATVTAPLAALNRRLVNSVTSISGSLTRRSHSVKQTPAASAIAKPARVRAEDHPHSGASMMVKTNAPSMTTDRIRPPRSSRDCRSGTDAGITSGAAAAAARAIGTRARNRLPHQNTSSSAPPRMGPMATPSPVTAPHSPMAIARCFGSRKVSVMMASVVG